METELHEMDDVNNLNLDCYRIELNNNLLILLKR